MRSDNPNNYEKIQCTKIEQQLTSIKEECDLYQVNKTWELTELLQDQKVIFNQQVHKKKKFYEIEYMGKAWVLNYCA